MTPTVRDLYHQLEPDPWRTAFSDDIAAVHERVLQPGVDRSAIADAINNWLASWQPCLFGKIAAKQGLLRFCVLTEDDLTRSDDEIRDAIQGARSRWWTDSFDGYASGFVLLAISERLANARPSGILQALATRLCSLHLFEQPPVAEDAVCTDSIFLEKPGKARRTWKWTVGINFFGSQGDGRWWHDHRIPGGIALSMNSVGHMAKSGAIHKAMHALDKSIDTVAEDWSNSHVSSLEKALVLAMRTIKVASEGEHPGTRLFDAAENVPSVACPFTLPPDLNGFNHCEYAGRYHTDHTIPSPYFRDDVGQPSDTRHFDNLDFTYLFDKTLDDYSVMAEGLQVREVDSSGGDGRGEKRGFAVPIEISVSDEPMLRGALERLGR